MNTRRYLIIIGMLLFICILAGLAGCFRVMSNRNQEDTITMAARKVGVEPTLDGLAGYITKSVQPGMSREQVERALSAMASAPLEVKRGKLEDAGADWGLAACDDILLKLHPLGWDVWKIIACYDAEGRLVLLKSRDPDYPPLNIGVPPRWFIFPEK